MLLSSPNKNSGMARSREVAVGAVAPDDDSGSIMAPSIKWRHGFVRPGFSSWQTRLEEERTRQISVAICFCVCLNALVRAESIDVSIDQSKVHATAIAPGIFRISVNSSADTLPIQSAFIDPDLAPGDVGKLTPRGLKTDRTSPGCMAQRPKQPCTRRSCWLLGRGLLAAPVLSEGTHRSVYLPSSPGTIFSPAKSTPAERHLMLMRHIRTASALPDDRLCHFPLPYPRRIVRCDHRKTISNGYGPVAH